jgi:Uma2 family endonuclease
MAIQTKVSAEDYLARVEAGERIELVDGEVREMSPVSYGHGHITARVSFLLTVHVDERDLGEVVTGEVLFRLDPANRTFRAADIAFIRRGREPGIEDEFRFYDGSPDMVVEIVSPSNLASDVQKKIAEWLGAGTELVLALYPELRSIVIWSSTGAVVRQGNDEVTFEPVLPGFRRKAREFFPQSRAREVS